MTSEAEQPGGSLYRPPTVPGIFMTQAKRFGSRVLSLSKKAGRWQEKTWTETLADLQRVTLALIAAGTGKGDRVGIMSQTRLEWSEADLACLCAGAVVVGIYPTASLKETAYIITHSGCRLIFVEDGELLGKVMAVRNEYHLPQRIVLFEAAYPLPDCVTSYEEFKHQGDRLMRRQPGLFNASWQGVRPEDLATIAYTSGTTGPPKGAMITHGNLYFTAINAAATQDLSPDDFGIAYLPLAHMLQRVTVYAAFHVGLRGVYAESIDKLIDNFREHRPTVQVGVPRVFEKIHRGIMQHVEAGPDLGKRLFSWALKQGGLAFARRLAKAPLPFGLQIKLAVADLLVLRKIRSLFGGRVKRLICGGAPLPRDLLMFYGAAGLPILEGYGLTETVAPVAVNRPGSFKIGTVGRLIEGIEARLGPDGELLLRGPGLFAGYYRDPAATAEAIDAEGWFHTGDIAAIDAEGFITIKDRKKEIIVTSGGKNISPQNIENLLKAHPLVANVMVHGDSRSHLIALFTLDADQAQAFARQEGISAASPDDLAGHPRLLAVLEGHIDSVNRDLAPYEAVRRFAVLAQDFTPATGELTPTLKLKRRQIAEKYRDLIDSLYGPNPACPASGDRRSSWPGP